MLRRLFLRRIYVAVVLLSALCLVIIGSSFYRYIIDSRYGTETDLNEPEITERLGITKRIVVQRMVTETINDTFETTAVDVGSIIDQDEVAEVLIILSRMTGSVTGIVTLEGSTYDLVLYDIDGNNVQTVSLWRGGMIGLNGSKEYYLDLQDIEVLLEIIERRCTVFVVINSLFVQNDRPLPLLKYGIHKKK